VCAELTYNKGYIVPTESKQVDLTDDAMCKSVFTAMKGTPATFGTIEATLTVAVLSRCFPFLSPYLYLLRIIIWLQ